MIMLAKATVALIIISVFFFELEINSKEKYALGYHE
jgi:hypothetical protein